jgi:hypothetical protein
MKGNEAPFSLAQWLITPEFHSPKRRLLEFILIFRGERGERGPEGDTNNIEERREDF